MNIQLTHWRLETDQDDVLWLWADHPESNTNVLTETALHELENLLINAKHNPPKGLVLISAKTNGFFAGADINAFTEDAALDFLHLGQGIFTLLENAQFPTLAALHGFCLGGGLEMALACDYRIAVDDTKTRIGLPEVKLGIHPGWGGSHRLPKLIGDMAAMEMMLSGRMVLAHQALKMGLVDQTPPARHLRNAASKWILKTAHRRKPARMIPRLLKPLVAWQMHHTVQRRAPVTHYPAPHALIDLWRNNSNDHKEAQSVAQLMTTETAHNLLRLFHLRNRLKSADQAYSATLNTIKQVHVIGAGVMGGDIAAWCAMKGFNVALQDSNTKALGHAIKRAHRLFKHRLHHRRPIQAAMDHLYPDPNGQALPQADVVIEAIYEDLNAKAELFRHVETQVGAHTLLCSNTSSLTLESLSETLQQPNRLIGLHFFNPVAKMPLVEIVHTADTHGDLIAQASQFIRQLDRLPLAVKSCPGFLVNRILMPYLLEAVVLESEGIKPVAIDLAAEAFGMPMGPLELADTVGLDICLAVGDVLAKHLGHSVPERLRELVADGQLGRKSGHGFYSWNGRKPHKGHATAVGPEISSRLILRLINESVACLREGIVSDADLLDAGVVFGTGFAPFRGGPLHYVEHKGIAGLHADLGALEATQGKRFHPDSGWDTWRDHHVPGAR